MCKNVIVDGEICETVGELKEQIGGLLVWAVSLDDIADEDCLCCLDVEGTAAKHGLIIEESNGWETILRRKPEQSEKEEGQVIDFARKKHAKLVLDAFDRLEHQDRRDQSEKRSEVERAARNRL